MMVIIDKKTVNKSAKVIALTFGITNCSIYILLIVVFFFSSKTLELLMNYLDYILIVAFGSFVISFITASGFKITSNENKNQVALIYSTLLVVNILILLIYLGFSNIGKGQLFG
jgi:hypothetical protein